MFKKKKIMLDITPLQHGYRPTSARSGIFFTLRNIMLQLLKRKDIDLYFHLNLNDSPNVEVMVKTVVEREFSEYRYWIEGRLFSEVPTALQAFCNFQTSQIAKAKERYRNNPLIFFFLRARFCIVNRVLLPLMSKFPSMHRNNMVYLSLMLDPPEYIKKQIPPQRRYLLLYDTIPMSIPEYAGEMNGWFGHVARNITPDSNYMAISQYTKKDFIHFYPFLKDQPFPVVDLAAAEYFRPISDEKVKKAVIEKYHLPTDKKIFFSHCSLAPHKNLEMLFRAFAEFYKTNQNWVMLFSGANIGGKMEKLTQIAQESGMPTTAFAFTGYVDDEELPVLYSIADVFCFVSLFEGFGLPILEAMQCGCPCLVSNATSIPEVVGDAALMVDPRNLEDIVRGLQKIAGDPGMWIEMSRKGLARSKKFSWVKAADQVVAAIRN